MKVSSKISKNKPSSTREGSSVMVSFVMFFFTQLFSMLNGSKHKNDKIHKREGLLFATEGNIVNKGLLIIC